MTELDAGVAADRVALRWLQTLEDIADRSAHELRGALNGVAVNVEVVRARSARATGEVAALAPFADAAASQLGELTRRVEALLVLARRPRSPLDIVETVHRLLTLLAPVARSGGGSIRLDDGESPDEARTTAAAPAARLLLGTALLLAAGERGDVTCRLARDHAIIVELRGAVPLAVPGDIVMLASEAGIAIDQRSTGITMAFPRAEA